VLFRSRALSPKGAKVQRDDGGDELLVDDALNEIRGGADDVVAQGYVADEFAWLARTPANAGAQALQKAGKTIGDVKRVEVNEAFSSVALNSVAMLGADPDTANVNGGAVALGHPIGATGAILTIKAMYELQRTGGRYGLITMCIGGGQGIAAIIERM